MDRRAGILLHISSLPGPYGIGDLGPAARHALIWMEAAGQRIWQVLPVQPTDHVGSPYAAPSAFARNPLLLSIDDLVDDGWLTGTERPWGTGSPTRVRYSEVADRKGRALALAAQRVVHGGADLAAWAETQGWVRDWCLFAALSEELGEQWTQWPEALRTREPAALAAASDRLAPSIQRHLALQWLFEQQWTRLRAEAGARGIALWGDVPIFVGGESCDVWANRHLFRLDPQGRPTVVTGVPPDHFNADGQYWGTPHYDVPAHAADGYRWWCDRLAATAALFDEVRIDHFRGLAGVWEIEAGAPATSGRWVPSFGPPLLDALRERLGGLPLVAEDLGVITPDVEALRDDFDLPGMAILQFAFSSPHQPGIHPFLPHNHRKNMVVYPGTHDNAPVAAWWQGVDELTRDHVRRYLSSDGRAPAADLARCAWRSVADTAIVPMQDILSLGAEARMNTPGEPEGNWTWRCGPEAFQVATAHSLAFEARLCGRMVLPPARPRPPTASDVGAPLEDEVGSGEESP